MTGKEKCQLLKIIRKEIAKANGIEYEPAECTYQGECRGFCPKCDDEVRYIEGELQRKAREGESIQIAGLAYPTFLDAIQQAHTETSAQTNDLDSETETKVEADAPTPFLTGMTNLRPPDDIEFRPFSPYDMLRDAQKDDMK